MPRVEDDTASYIVHEASVTYNCCAAAIQPPRCPRPRLADCLCLQWLHYSARARPWTRGERHRRKCTDAAGREVCERWEQLPPKKITVTPLHAHARLLQSRGARCSRPRGLGSSIEPVAAQTRRLCGYAAGLNWRGRFCWSRLFREEVADEQRAHPAPDRDAYECPYFCLEPEHQSAPRRHRLDCFSM